MFIKRREFIKLSGITMAGSVFIPPLLQSCGRVPLSNDASGYLEHFEVTTAQLKKVILTAMSKGGDYADLFFEHTKSNTASLQDNKVNSALSNIKYGVGIRVLKGDQTGFAYAENTSLEAMIQAAKTAANIADSNASATDFPMGNSTHLHFIRLSVPGKMFLLKIKCHSSQA